VPTEHANRDTTLRRLLEEIDRLRGAEDRLDAEVAQLRETVAVLEEECRHRFDAYDLAPVASLMLDRHGTIWNLNRRALQLLRFGKPQLIGVPLLVLLTQPYRRRFLEHVLASKRTPDPIAFEVMVTRSEREVIPVRLSLRWTTEEGGSYAVDLIDLRERDAALADYQRLACAEREAREANQAKDRLIAFLIRGLRSRRRTRRHVQVRVRPATQVLFSVRSRHRIPR
jgi:hypothetical protein